MKTVLTLNKMLLLLKEVAMAETEAAVNGASEQLSLTDEVRALEEEEKKEEEAKKKAREPPIVYKDLVDVSNGLYST